MWQKANHSRDLLAAAVVAVLHVFDTYVAATASTAGQSIQLDPTSMRRADRMTSPFKLVTVKGMTILYVGTSSCAGAGILYWSGCCLSGGTTESYPE